MKYIVLYKQNEMLYSYTHIFSSRCISSHTQFPSSSNFKELERKSVDLDLTYSSAHHQHNETVDDGTTPEQANLSVVLPTKENSL